MLDELRRRTIRDSFIAGWHAARSQMNSDPLLKDEEEAERRADKFVKLVDERMAEAAEAMAVESTNVIDAQRDYGGRQ